MREPKHQARARLAKLVPKNPIIRGATRAKQKAATYVAERDARRAMIAELMADLRVPGALYPAASPDPAATRERYQEFLTLLSSGAATEIAIRVSGINRKRFRDWMTRGGDAAHNRGEDKTEEAEEPYRSFALAVRAVQARSTQDLVELVRSGALSDWKAAAWLLERRAPEEYGSKATQIVVGGETDDQPQVLIYIPANGREVNPDCFQIGEGSATAGDNPVSPVEIEPPFRLSIPSNGREAPVSTEGEATA